MTTQIDRNDLVGLPEVAERLGVHRATVNDMVRSERLPAVREGAHWFVSRAALDEFAATYVKPSNAPRSRERRLPESTPQLLSLLAEFESATALELAPFVSLHEGNVRKHLRLMENAGLVTRRVDGEWQLTSSGTDVAELNQPTMSVA